MFDRHPDDLDDDERKEYERRYAADRNDASEYDPEEYASGDHDGPVDWFDTIISNQILTLCDTGASELTIHEPFSGPRNPDRYRLRLRHPDTWLTAG